MTASVRDSSSGTVPRRLVLAYGATTYVAFLVVFATFVPFVTNAGVVRGIDRGERSSVAASLLIDVGLLALFGISHSTMARARFKELLVRIIPPAAERSTYVLVATLTLGLLLWQWRPMPAIVWNVRSPAIRAALWASSGIGVLLVVYSSFLTDHFDLFGLRPVWLYARGRAYEPVPFKERSLYRFVRHPMMLGILLWFWSTPSLSVGHLLFSTGMSIYIIVGVGLEERDLVRHLGEVYLQYRQRVGRFIPWL